MVTVITVGLLVYGMMIYNYKCWDCPLKTIFPLFLNDHYYKDLRTQLTLEFYWISITIILLKVLYLFELQTFNKI